MVYSNIASLKLVTFSLHPSNHTFHPPLYPIAPTPPTIHTTIPRKAQIMQLGAKKQEKLQKVTKFCFLPLMVLFDTKWHFRAFHGLGVWWGVAVEVICSMEGESKNEGMH